MQKVPQSRITATRPGRTLFLALAVECCRIRGMKEIELPPSRACNICRYKMSDICSEKCAPAKDYRFFEPDMRRELPSLPTLSFQEYLELPSSMKGKWLFVQQTKILEALNGDELRTHLDYSRSRPLSKTLKKQGLHHGSTRINPTLEDRKER